MNTDSPQYAIQLTTLSTTLSKEVAALSKIVNPNPTMPILSNFLFDIKRSQTTITASDLQTSAVTTLSIEATNEGRIAIPATILLETLRSLPQQPIQLLIDTGNYSLTIKTRNGQYRIACENATDFPTIPVASTQKVIAMEMKVLKKAISKTTFATGKDDMRPALTGVNISIDQQDTTLAATDGHKLVSYTHTATTSDTPYAITIPAKPLQVISQLLPDTDQRVNVIVEPNNIFLWFDHIQIITSAVDEVYPDYEHIIPQNNEHILTIKKDTLRNVAKTITYYANKSTYQIILSLEENQLELQAEDLQFANQAQTALSCSYQGPSMKVGLNAEFLLEILNHMPGGDINIYFKDPQSAVLLQPTEPAPDEKLLMLLMPVTL